jgi:Protein of unknown function (DUF1189)
LIVRQVFGLEQDMNKTIVTQDTQQFSYLSALYRSFYSASFYIDLVKRWKGFGFVYLIFLLGVISIPAAVHLGNKALDYINNDVIKPVTQVPVFTIKDGKISMDKPMPYIIKNSQGQPAVIIDTTSKTKTLDTKKYPHVILLITQDSFITRLGQKEPKKSSIKLFGTERVDLSTLKNNQAIESAKNSLKFLIYPMLVSIVFGILVVPLLIFSFLGQMMSKVFFSYDIRFKQATRVTMSAATPCLVLLYSFVYSKFTSPFTGLILFFVLLGYFIFGILANRRYAKLLARQ